MKSILFIILTLAGTGVLAAHQTELEYALYGGWRVLELHEDGVTRRLFKIDALRTEDDITRILITADIPSLLGRLADLTVEIHPAAGDEPEVLPARLFKRCLCGDIAVDLPLTTADCACDAVCPDAEQIDVEYFFRLRALAPGESLGIGCADPAGPDSLWLVEKEAS